MPSTPEQIRQAVAAASASLQRGNLAHADMLCQAVLAQGVRPAEVVFVAGRVATTVGDYETGRRHFEEILASNPSDRAVTEALSDLTRLEGERRAIELTTNPKRRERYHLIKAWGCGFTSDVDHTLGHLLLAEMTGRTPIIHWGKNSLFRDVDVENAWPEFFEPVSPLTIRDVAQQDYTFFPPKWNAGNIECENINKFIGPGSRTPGICFLNRGDNVTVGDFFTSVIDLLPWVRPPHPLAMNGPVTPFAIEAAYRYLVARYLRPKAEILVAVASFAARNFGSGEILAVHVRGNDKAIEFESSLAAAHQKIFDEVKAHMATKPDLSVFLLTDDVPIRDQYISAFPGRVITTDCIRSSTGQGVHYQPAPSRRQLGIEVLCDVYLAARCDRLIGLGCTNVSNLILHLKQWPKGSFQLLGTVIHHHSNSNFMLHV